MPYRDPDALPCQSALPCPAPPEPEPDQDSDEDFEEPTSPILALLPERTTIVAIIPSSIGTDNIH
jgi:hypothetical protein